MIFLNASDPFKQTKEFFFVNFNNRAACEALSNDRNEIVKKRIWKKEN